MLSYDADNGWRNIELAAKVWHKMLALQEVVDNSEQCSDVRKQRIRQSISRLLHCYKIFSCMS